MAWWILSRLVGQAWRGRELERSDREVEDVRGDEHGRWWLHQDPVQSVVQVPLSPCLVVRGEAVAGWAGGIEGWLAGW